MSALPGQKIGRYSLTSLLGRGGMAEVYRAHDPQLDRDVAIKLILPQFGDEPGFGERFANEARAVARLRHPNIVEVHDFDIVGGRPYMVMELADGPSLKQRLQALRDSNQPLPLAEVLSIADAIGSAVDYAHRQGMVHRDIKPSNILFTQSGDPLLADFGLAQITGQSLHTAVGSVSGTPAYMAPEQAQGKPEAASDLYSLAVVVYEMLAGRPPFVGATPTELLLQHLQTPPPPPLSFRADLPAGLTELFQKALSKVPSERYATAGDFVTALRSALQPQAAAAPVSQEALTVHAEVLPIPASLATQPPAAAPAPRPSTTPQPVPGGLPASGNLPRVVSVLGSVALVLAPLIGREKLAVSPNADNRRSAIASLMAILGIFLAAVQFLASAFELAYRVFAPLSQVLPIIIMLALGLGALVAIRLLRRSGSIHYRRYAALVLALVAVGGAGWGGWQLYERTRPPAGPIVIIADFQQCKGCSEVDHGQRIYTAVKAQTDRLRLPNLEVRHVLETYPDAATARARGADYKATLVIWGSYDTAGILPHFELLRAPEVYTLDPVSASASAGADPSQPAPRVSPSHLLRPDELSVIDFHAQNGDNETAFVTILALGLIRYAERDYATALRVYDAALASIGGDPSKDVPNAEVVYFYKALALYANGESWTDVVDNLKKTLAVRPSWAEPHYVLALASLQSCTPDGKRTLDVALAESETAVRLRPDANSYWLRGQVLAELRRWSDAAKSYEQSLKQLDDLEVRSELAAAYRNLGRDADATALLAQAAPAPVLQTDEVSALRAKANTLYAQGSFTESVVSYQQAISRAVELKQPAIVLAAVYLQLAGSQVALEQFAAAVVSYQKSESLWGKHWLGYYGLAYAYSQLNRTDDAIAAYQKVVADTPCDAVAHAIIANLFEQQGKAAAALEEYRKASTADPANGNVLVSIANLLSAQGKPDEAQATRRTAAGLLEVQLQQEPGNATAAFLLGLTDYELHEYGAALEALQKYVVLAPADGSGHDWLASTLDALGRRADALTERGKAAVAYQQAISQNPQNRSALLKLGMLQYNLGNYAESAKAFEGLIRVSPDNAQAHASLALAYLGLNRAADALVEYRAAATLQPNNADFQTNLAFALVSQGQNDEAITVARRALQLDSSQVWAHYTLGVAYRSQGDKSQAIVEFQAVAQSPAATAGLRNLAEQALRELAP